MGNPKFRSHAYVFACGILQVCRSKYLCSYFPFHFCFLVFLIFFISELILIRLLSAATIILSLLFLMLSTGHCTHAIFSPGESSSSFFLDSNSLSIIKINNGVLVIGKFPGLLANLSNAVVWIVLIHPPISKSSSPLSKFFFFFFGTVPSTPIKIGTTLTLIFHSVFSSLTQSKYLSLF